MDGDKPGAWEHALYLFMLCIIGQTRNVWPAAWGIAQHPAKDYNII